MSSAVTDVRQIGSIVDPPLLSPRLLREACAAPRAARKELLVSATFQVPGRGRTLELSPRRHEVAQRLAQRAWFQATDPGLQLLLLTLPEDAAKKNDWTGLLEDLA